MRFIRFSALVLSLTLLGSTPCYPDEAADAPDSGEIAKTLKDFRERYFVANNGKDKMLSVRSMRVEAELTRPDGDGGKMVFIKQKPNYVRSVWYAPRGMTVRKGYNGKESWELVTAPNGSEKGRILPEVPPDVFEWVIADPEACGAKLEMLPVERSERSELYHIRATFNDGRVKNYYLDTTSFCESKVVETETDGTVKTFVVESPIKYNGIWFPGVQIQYDASGKEVARVKIDDVKMNVGIFPCFFDPPESLKNSEDTGNSPEYSESSGQ